MSVNSRENVPDTGEIAPANRFNESRNVVSPEVGSAR
jgi:hypothetical protein